MKPLEVCTHVNIKCMQRESEDLQYVYINSTGSLEMTGINYYKILKYSIVDLCNSIYSKNTNPKMKNLCSSIYYKNTNPKMTRSFNAK